MYVVFQGRRYFVISVKFIKCVKYVLDGIYMIQKKKKKTTFYKNIKVH